VKFIVYIDDFEIEGFAAKIIPLRVDIIIINSLRELEFAVFGAVKRR
jgi:hypothetical protein